MARPTKYNADILKQAEDYIQVYDWYGDVFPSIVGLAVILGVGKSSIYDWAAQEDKKEFSDILAKLSAKSEQVLITEGLKSNFNSNITKLVLGKFGYHDKIDASVDTTVKKTRKRFDGE